MIKPTTLYLLGTLLTSLPLVCFSQGNTQIRGFVDVSASYADNKLSFGLGEQDLFITSELNDRFSFLGETVFKYDATSQTRFSISIERIVLKYNIKGNHNILMGKHHTPINYWNDTYHHGRVFFPTINRPMIFSTRLFPIHTTGISFQGLNLGPLKFGYDLMVGNGLGSTDILDVDKSKSITAAVHIKPRTGMRLGVSYYYDRIPKGTDLHSGYRTIGRTDAHLITASAANFSGKLELLAESTYARAKVDSVGHNNSLFSYVYAGYKVTDKIIPYIRYDNLLYEKGEVGKTPNNASVYMAGIRYQINYLAVVKLEYQRQYTDSKFSGTTVTTQVAIGF
jgi:hypothetical protein